MFSKHYNETLPSQVNALWREPWENTCLRFQMRVSVYECYASDVVWNSAFVDSL